MRQSLRSRSLRSREAELANKQIYNTYQKKKNSQARARVCLGGQGKHFRGAAGRGFPKGVLASRHPQEGREL